MSGEEARRTSEILAALAEGEADQRIAVGQIVAALHDRAFGLLILIFALPNGVPGPSLPGLSTVLGVPLIILSAQLAVGRADPWLPGFVLRWSFRRGDFARVIKAAHPSLRRMERLFRPRLLDWAGRRADRWTGLLILLISVVLFLPIPLTNLPMAWGIVLIALGLIEQDGLAILIGLLVGAAGAVAAIVLLVLGWSAVTGLVGFSS